MASPTVQPTSTAGRAVARVLGSAAETRDPLILAGAAALAAAIVLTIVAPPTLLTVPLGFIAVVGLAREPRLGALPAAILVILAVPYGRAADVDLPGIAGAPLRFHDAALVAALLLTVPRLRRPVVSPQLVPLVLAWFAVGVFALGLGIGEAQPARDIVRDVRWWSLYGFALVAILAGTHRPPILRAVLVGATIYAALLFVTAVLPDFDGGLKARAVAYDRGLLRLQFSNGVFVVFAAAWVLYRLERRPSWGRALWFALLAGAVVLSLTRMSIYVLIGLSVLSLLVLLGRTLISSHRQALRRAAIIVTLVAVPTVVAVGAIALGDPGSSSNLGTPQSLLDRFLFRSAGSGIDQIAEGRFETYRSAIRIIGQRALLGQGLGTLVDYGFTPGGARPSTPGKQPAVDNAYLTVAMKAGLVGLGVFVLFVAWPFVEIRRRPRDRLAWMFAIPWLGVLALTMTQSFATGGYSPFVLALLVAFLALRPRPAPDAPVAVARS
jgi:O-antigen ligase